MIDHETVLAEEREQNDWTRTIIGLALYELAYALTEWEEPNDG